MPSSFSFSPSCRHHGITFGNGETVPVTYDKKGETSSTNLKLQYLQYEHASTAPIQRPPTFHATNEDLSVPPVMINDNDETQLSSTFKKRSSNLSDFYNNVDSRQCSHQLFQSHPKAKQTRTHNINLESFSSTRKRIVIFSPSLVTEVWFGPSSKRIEEEWHQYYCSSDELEHYSLIDEEYGMSWQKMGTPMLKRAVITIPIGIAIFSYLFINYAAFLSSEFLKELPTPPK